VNCIASQHVDPVHASHYRSPGDAGAQLQRHFECWHGDVAAPFGAEANHAAFSSGPSRRHAMYEKESYSRSFRKRPARKLATHLDIPRRFVDTPPGCGHVLCN
jgi:hypothetical protein